MEKLYSPEGSQSNETLPASKPAAKKPARKKAGGSKKPKNKSSKRSAKKVSTRRKPAKKRGVKQGRPLLNCTDATVVRLPKGWLKILNAKAKAKGLKQSVFLREAVGRAIGKKS